MERAIRFWGICLLQDFSKKYLQKMLETTQSHLQLMMNLGDKNKAGMEETSKHYLELKYENQRNMQEHGKR